MSDAFRVHTYAAGKRRRWSPERRTTPVESVIAVPDVWATVQAEMRRAERRGVRYTVEIIDATTVRMSNRTEENRS